MLLVTYRVTLLVLGQILWEFSVRNMQNLGKLQKFRMLELFKFYELLDIFDVQFNLR